MSKLFNFKMDKEISDSLDSLSKKYNLSKSETLRKAILFLENSDKVKQENKNESLETENKQLIITVKTMEVLRHETAELYEQTKKAKEKEAELYEQLLAQQRIELTTKEKEMDLYKKTLQELHADKKDDRDLIQQLKTDCQKKGAEIDLLQGKVDEIKKAGIFKRIFLKFS